MKHSEMPVQVETAEVLTREQEAAVSWLVTLCQEHDDIKLSYPCMPGEAESHYLCWGSLPGQLLAVLAVVPCGEMLAECISFTHPSYRKRGYFSQLLERMLEDQEETDILFPVSGTCADTMAALEALGAEPYMREYRMEKKLGRMADCPGMGCGNEVCRETEACKGQEASAFLRIVEKPEEDILKADYYIKNDTAGETSAGSLQLTSVSDAALCLHHVEILPEYRGRGLGTRMLQCLFDELEKRGITKLILQVSGDNLPAMALYRKTGFRITETLSYYWY